MVLLVIVGIPVKQIDGSLRDEKWGFVMRDYRGVSGRFLLVSPDQNYKLNTNKKQYRLPTIDDIFHYYEQSSK